MSKEMPDAETELSHGFRSKFNNNDSVEFGTDDYNGELLTKQAEMIQYLQEQKLALSKQILQLRQQVDDRSLRHLPEDDIEHRLTNKDQEIRSLVAEKETLAETVEQLRKEFKQASKLAEQFTAASEELEAKKEENTRLKVQLDIEKDSNTDAQALVTKLSRELATLKQGYEGLLQK